MNFEGWRRKVSSHERRNNKSLPYTCVRRMVIVTTPIPKPLEAILIVKEGQNTILWGYTKSIAIKDGGWRAEGGGGEGVCEEEA